MGWGLDSVGGDTLTSQNKEDWPQLGSYAAPPTCPGCPTVVLGRWASPSPGLGAQVEARPVWPNPQLPFLCSSESGHTMGRRGDL